MLKDKTVVITGGANGIGFATAECFIKEGCNVVIADIAEQDGIEASRVLNADNKCFFIKTNTGDELSIENMASAALNRFGKIDILVNCAARFIMKGIEANLSEWEDVCKVNIAGYALTAKYCVPHMIKAGQGVIVNVCSISALVAQPNFVTYSATKGAVDSMTRCMALDLAKYNIRVNAVSPGTVWTKSNEDFHKNNLSLSRKEADEHPKIGGLHILNRTANPCEIAEVIVFLSSDKSSFITAQNIIADGGYTAL